MEELQEIIKFLRDMAMETGAGTLSVYSTKADGSGFGLRYAEYNNESEKLELFPELIDDETVKISVPTT